MRFSIFDLVRAQHGAVEQREGLVGGADEYKGVKVETIARECLKMLGGVPQVGEKYSRLYKLATRLRYVCDFDGARVLKAMPDCGLGKEELRILVHSAMDAPLGKGMPRDFQDLLDKIVRRAKTSSDDAELAREIEREEEQSL